MVYSMGSDGLLPKFLAKILPRFKVPIVASIITGLISAILSTIFNLDQLIDMSPIGTLMSFILVSLCVLLLRYKPNKSNIIEENIYNDNQRFPKLFIFLFFGNSNDTLFQKFFSPSIKETNAANYRFVCFITFIASIFFLCLISLF